MEGSNSPEKFNGSQLLLQLHGEWGPVCEGVSGFSAGAGTRGDLKVAPAQGGSFSRDPVLRGGAVSSAHGS